MSKIAPPALLPAASAVLGVCLAGLGVPTGATRVWLPLAGLLVALGWGLGGRFGRAAICFGAGLLASWSGSDADRRCLERIDASRPVELVATMREPWRPSLGGWRASVTPRRVKQGPRVLRCGPSIRLDLSSEARLGNALEVRFRGFVRRLEPHRNGTITHPLPARGRALWRLHVKSARFWSDEPANRGLVVGPLAWKLREGLAIGLDRESGRNGVGAARALVLGDRTALAPRHRQTLRRFGLAHLFAVSGLHVALVALAGHAALGVLPHGWRRLGGGLCVMAYLLLIGGRSSVLRAVGMALLGWLAVGQGRPRSPRQGLCLAAGALALGDPGLVREVGYQLTVSATAGILWLKPLLESRWSLLPPLFRSGLAATVGAQLASLPWSAAVFSAVHPAAPFLNLFAIPWVTLFGALSFVAALLMRLMPKAAPAVASALDLGIRPLDWLDALPAAPLWLWPTAIGVTGGGLAALALGGALLARPVGLRWLALAIGLILLRGPGLPRTAEMVMLDVGQGDAIVLHDGSRALLVDGGGWRRGDIAGSVTMPALARLGVRRLAGIVVTHSDVDHCRGVVDLVRYLPVERLWSPPGDSRSSCVRELAAAPGVRWRGIWRGEQLRVGRLRVDVLHPEPASRDLGNDGSLVLRASIGARRVLLTGDLEANGEQRLLRSLAPGELRSAILKVGHHGSRTSTTARFLGAVRPTVAAVSAGRRNRYGHPATEVVSRLRRRGALLVRTDRDGMVRLPLEPGSR